MVKKRFKVDDTIFYCDGKSLYPVKIIEDNVVSYVGMHHGNQKCIISFDNEQYYFDNMGEIPDNIWLRYFR